IRHAATRVDDHVAAWQEAVGDANRLIERAARVAAQVEHEPLHAARRERLQRLTELLVRVLAEVAELDVPRRRIQHERGWHGRNVDLVAGDLKVYELVIAAALQGHANRCALRTTQATHGLVTGP